MNHSDDILLIISREEPFLEGYSGFHNIENKYLLANGILLKENGEVIWNVPWEHGYTVATYLKEQSVILTNRTSSRGFEHPFGNCCIDFKTGKYKWRHWYNNSCDEWEAMVKRQPDINLVTHYDYIEENGEWIWRGPFRVNIRTSAVEEHLENQAVSRIKLHSLPEIHSYPKNAYNHPIIHFGIQEVVLDQKQYRKDNYFFTKCHSVIEIGDFLYFFGIPAKNNSRGTILFKYSLSKKTIVKEIEFPSRYNIEGVYDFFGKGLLIYEISYGKAPVNRLWFIKNEAL